jgi:DNA-3-methyladenine glycosylase I
VNNVQEQHWQLPSWWYRENRPSNDEAYFENMSHVIFEAGLNWQVTDNKWPNIKEAFMQFDIQKVAAFTAEDVANLLKDPEIIRNKGKILAVIQNAQNFVAIKKRYGSFQKYLDSQDKSDNYQTVVKDLINKFKWLGPSSATLFLYSVGEDIDVWEH